MIDNLIHWSISVVSHYGLWGVFSIMTIENLGIPFPTEAGFLVAQKLISNKQISFFYAFLIINLGLDFGAVVSYLVGRYGDELLIKKLDRTNKIEKTHQKIINWYGKYGNITVFATRLIGYVRPWSSFVAGLAEVPFGMFLLWTILGSAIFSLITMIFTKYLIHYWNRFENYHVLIGISLAICFFGLLIYELFKYIFKKRD